MEPRGQTRSFTHWIHRLIVSCIMENVLSLGKETRLTELGLGTHSFARKAPLIGHHMGMTLLIIQDFQDLDLAVFILSAGLVFPEGPTHPHIDAPQSVAIDPIHILVIHELGRVGQDDPLDGV